jgi:hypothetical protein
MRIANLSSANVVARTCAEDGMPRGGGVTKTVQQTSIRRTHPMAEHTLGDDAESSVA